MIDHIEMSTIVSFTNYLKKCQPNKFKQCVFVYKIYFWPISGLIAIRQHQLKAISVLFPNGSSLSGCSPTRGMVCTVRQVRLNRDKTTTQSLLCDKLWNGLQRFSSSIWIYGRRCLILCVERTFKYQYCTFFYCTKNVSAHCNKLPLFSHHCSSTVGDLLSPILLNPLKLLFSVVFYFYLTFAEISLTQVTQRYKVLLSIMCLTFD